MTNEERKVFELALEALQMLHDENMDYLTRNKLGGENNQCMVFARETITAIKESLAQPDQDEVDIRSRLYQRIHELETQLARGEQEPVGKFAKFTDNIWREVTDGSAGVPLYTTPPQRTWVELTDDDEIPWDGVDAKSFAKAIEAKLKEKNNA